MSELIQQPFGEDEDNLLIATPNEPHMACVLLVDTSYSMAGEAINSLNDSINAFKEQTMMDDLARNRVDVAIIEFNSAVQLVQDFMPVGAMSPVRLQAHGMTAMGQGIEYAIEKVKERCRLYNALGTPCFKPWIFMITDGCPDETEDMYSAMMKIAAEEERNKLKFFALGVKGYNKEVLFSLTQRVIELKDVNFSSIFNWLSESMVTISVSRVGENVILENLPQDARKADKDRDINDW